MKAYLKVLGSLIVMSFVIVTTVGAHDFRDPARVTYDGCETESYGNGAFGTTGFAYKAYEDGLEVECGDLTAGVKGSYIIVFSNHTYDNFKWEITKEPEGTVLFSDSLSKFDSVRPLGGIDFQSFEEVGEYILHIYTDSHFANNYHFVFNVLDADGKRKKALKAILVGLTEVLALDKGISDFCGGGNAELFARHRILSIEQVLKENNLSLNAAELSKMIILAGETANENEVYTSYAMLDAMGNMQEQCDVILMTYLARDCGDDPLCVARVLKQFE